MLASTSTFLHPLFLSIVLVAIASYQLWIFKDNGTGVIATTVEWSYVGDDHPGTWPITAMKDVRLKQENTVHYLLQGEKANEQWDNLAPNNGIIHLGPHYRPFMLGFFHQFKCLDIIRRAISHAIGPSPSVEAPSVAHVEHCMTYIHQTVMCRSNNRLEMGVGLYEEHNFHTELDHTCRDWRVVYDAAKRNADEYMKWKKTGQNDTYYESS